MGGPDTFFRHFARRVEGRADRWGTCGPSIGKGPAVTPPGPAADTSMTL